MQRTFIAFKIIPERDMSDCIQHVQDLLRDEKIKWVDPEKVHITLRFLGDSSPAQVNSIKKVLEELVPNFPAPEVLFTGLGVFPNTHDPRVIWIGMDSGPDLQELKTSIDRKLVPLGFTPEKRKFRPHLTLGRIKHQDNQFPRRISGILEGLLEEYRNMRFQKNLVKELFYLESILRKRVQNTFP